MAHGKLLDVISYSGDSETLVYRSEIQNFNSMSQLIVDESQEALFYKDGRALDLFGPGRYTLKSDNFPIIRNFYGKVFGGRDVFTCSVIFVNKGFMLNIPWGTQAPIIINDKEYDIIVKVRAYGSLSIHIEDSRKFVVNLLKGRPTYTNKDITKDIRDIVAESVSDRIANAFREKEIPVLEIQSYQSEISAQLNKEFNKEFLDRYGVECVKFATIINPDENDLEKLKEAKNLAASRRVQGYDYQTERQFNVLETAAGNEGAGNVMAPGMGLGMGFGVGKSISNSMENNIKDVMSPNEYKCPECGTSIGPNAKFCPECGAKIARKKFCTNCGKEIASGAKFCPECGSKVE